jgi:hypothetical protein
MTSTANAASPRISSVSNGNRIINKLNVFLSIYISFAMGWLFIAMVVVYLIVILKLLD